MFYQIKSYIKFYLASKKKHGIHSPFVFDLGNHCFYTKPNKSFDKKINEIKNSYLNSDGSIGVTDFGAGSKRLETKQRHIKDIAKNAGISLKRVGIIANLIHYTKANQILEIGTSLGIGTAAMALANLNANITTLEGCPNTAQIAQNTFDKFNLSNIKITIGEFSTTLPTILKDKTFDLIYFDGNHQKEATVAYFNLCLNHIHNETVFIFDDIYWSEGMTAAWNEIRQHPKVTVSIDTYRWGLVFFRDEQIKEHFVIRV